MNYRYEIVHRGGKEAVKMVIDTLSVVGEMEGIWRFTLGKNAKPIRATCSFDPAKLFLESFEDLGQPDRKLVIRNPQIYFNLQQNVFSGRVRIGLYEKKTDSSGEWYAYVMDLTKNHAIYRQLDKVCEYFLHIVQEEFLRHAVNRKIKQKQEALQKTLAKQMEALQLQADANTEWLTNNNCQMI